MFPLYNSTYSTQRRIGTLGHVWSMIFTCGAGNSSAHELRPSCRSMIQDGRAKTLDNLDPLVNVYITMENHHV